MNIDFAVKGTIVTKHKVYKNSMVAVNDEKIVGILNEDTMINKNKVIDCKGSLILPGVVDNHTHSLGYEKEGHWNATKSGAAGGVTTINDHPLDIGGAPCTPQEIRKKAEKTASESLVDFTLLSGGKPEKLKYIKETSDLGVTGFKMLMHATSGASEYNMRALNEAELYMLFEEISNEDNIAMLHAENDSIINYLVDKWKKNGKTYFAAHHETRPEITETLAVIKAIELAKALNCRIHLLHLSLPRSFELINRAKKEGVKVSGETCPHYLVCNNERWKEVGANFKINPPLRTESNRISLWDKLAQGEIDLIASDHAPHSPNNKENIFENFSGSPGIETMLPLIFHEGVNKGRINVKELVKLLSFNPAQLNGIYPQKGNIEVGADADLVVFDPEQRWTINGEDLLTSPNWTLYEGMEIKGKVKRTFVRGEEVYSNGEISGQKGKGKWLKRNYCNPEFAG